MSSFRVDLTNSANDFLRVVWPAIGHRLGSGDIIPVEGSTSDELAKLLDTNAGIDLWQVCQAGQMRGIASRVQWTDLSRSWDTFTIRYYRQTTGFNTEYLKRCRSHDFPDQGWLNPYYTIQAYIEKPAGKGALLSVAAVKTSRLMDVAKLIEQEYKDAGCDAHEFDWWTCSSGAGGVKSTGNALFIYVNWDFFGPESIDIWRPTKSKLSLCSDLESVWADVISVVQPLGTRALMQQQGSLVFLDQTTARVGVNGRPFFKMVQGRVDNLADAFEEVLGRRVNVCMEVLEQAEAKVSSYSNIQSVWARVISVLGSTFIQERGSLVFLDQTTARIGFQHQLYLALAQPRVNDLADAFEEVLGRRVNVCIEVLEPIPF